MLRINMIDYLENHLAKHLWLVKEKEMQQFIIVKNDQQSGNDNIVSKPETETNTPPTTDPYVGMTKAEFYAIICISQR